MDKMDDPDVARAVAVAEELERRKKARGQLRNKNLGLGCLAIIGFFIVIGVIGSLTSKSTDHPGSATNDVSRYGQRVHDLFAVDLVGGREVATDAAAGDITKAYAAAKQGRDAMDQYRSLYREDAPAGFERTATAVDAYLVEIRDGEMKALDDPRPSTAVDMVEKVQLTYAKAVIDSFTSDLAHTPLSKQEKNRVMDKLLGGIR